MQYGGNKQNSSSWASASESAGKCVLNVLLKVHVLTFWSVSSLWHCWEVVETLGSGVYELLCALHKDIKSLDIPGSLFPS